MHTLYLSKLEPDSFDCEARVLSLSLPVVPQNNNNSHLQFAVVITKTSMMMTFTLQVIEYEELDPSS